MDNHLPFYVFRRYHAFMSDVTSRKYIKTTFEGVFYRLSSRIRNPKTGEPDRIYCFCYTDARGKGHWKTAGRHSEGIRPPMVRSERAKFIAEIASTGINPATRDSVTIGQLVDACLAWGRSEGKVR